MNRATSCIFCDIVKHKMRVEILYEAEYYPDKNQHCK